MNVIRTIYLDPRLVPGGGATEMTLANKLVEQSKVQEPEIANAYRAAGKVRAPSRSHRHAAGPLASPRAQPPSLIVRSIVHVAGARGDPAHAARELRRRHHPRAHATAREARGRREHHVGHRRRQGVSRRHERRRRVGARLRQGAGGHDGDACRCRRLAAVVAQPLLLSRRRSRRRSSRRRCSSVSTRLYLERTRRRRRRRPPSSSRGRPTARTAAEPTEAKPSARWPPRALAPAGPRRAAARPLALRDARRRRPARAPTACRTTA